MKLRYDQWAARDAGVTIEPDEELRRLGIDFDHGKAVDGTATFYGCRNVPPQLPDYIRVAAADYSSVTYKFSAAADKGEVT